MNVQPQMKFPKPENESRALGAKLREAREYIGLKQEQTARHLGVPRTAVSDMETGKRSVSALELKKLAQLYRRPVQCFTGDEPGIPADIAFLGRTASSLSDTDRRELQRFAEFLQAKSKR